MEETKYCKDSMVIQTHRIFPFDLNPFGYLFGGKLMTMIDDAASISVTRHCRRGAVTASLDSLNFLKPLHENHSVCVESYVSGAHKKSMEVFVKIIGENLTTGERYLAATCFTTFVAVPSHMNLEKEFTVPHVIPESAEEQLVCKGYDERRTTRQQERTAYKEFAANLSLDLPWTRERE
ncbi:acyl-CoA thioesterase [Enterococcus mundtii]|uniref:acyl-CoA thioesterase n=1 Tax=Enterococcus TaxID=1350 RepID=UPI000445FE6D|nr:MULTISPECIES: acyl-CoA thioesterase [Enterococcus]MCW6015567.1 acyl-CoA thioesterase [Serratia marcescens]AZP93801.1 acyl-CoA thioesterase [Enterococcus mundtii]EYT95007.1 acyl-CoA thioester hydrolase [Enterococcus mundtii CRL35]MDA9427653.1 Acyl-CoA hydrolase [Enterococcus mundtii 1A]MDK4212384.1 acyl-CoA thioesterase [Enterococcus mundtii]